MNYLGIFVTFILVLYNHLTAFQCKCVAFFQTSNQWQNPTDAAVFSLDYSFHHMAFCYHLHYKYWDQSNVQEQDEHQEQDNFQTQSGVTALAAVGGHRWDTSVLGRIKVQRGWSELSSGTCQCFSVAEQEAPLAHCVHSNTHAHAHVMCRGRGRVWLLLDRVPRQQTHLRIVQITIRRLTADTLTWQKRGYIDNNISYNIALWNADLWGLLFPDNV